MRAGQKPILGVVPNASTEVVMADRRSFAPTALASMAFMLSRSLIPVLVTGNHQLRLGVVRGSSRFPRRYFTPSALGDVQSGSRDAVCG